MALYMPKIGPKGPILALIWASRAQICIISRRKENIFSRKENISLEEKYFFSEIFSLFVLEYFSFFREFIFVWAECDREMVGGNTPKPRVIRALRALSMRALWALLGPSGLSTNGPTALRAYRPQGPMGLVLA